MSARRRLLLVVAALANTCLAADSGCGEPISLSATEGGSLRYALRRPAGGEPAPVLVLLVGGSGFLDLDANGCPRQLRNNSLVRLIPLFLDRGFATALVDAPSSHQQPDGLGGYRIAPGHAEDLGGVIGDLRQRIGPTVWLVGTSRGTLSAANAAARLGGANAPDGVVLTSALMAGQQRARKSWVEQSLFDLPLEKIRPPVLLVGHAADACVRSPAERMPDVALVLGSRRKQVVRVEGGPGPAAAGIDACIALSPHGFLEQEAEVADGIVRFVRGGTY